MNRHMLYALIMPAVVAAALLIGSVAPVAAASVAPIHTNLVTPEQIVYQCYWRKVWYKVGKVINLPAPLGYMRCELTIIVGAPGLRAIWVHYAD